MDSPATALIDELQKQIGRFMAETEGLATEQEIRSAQARFLGKKGTVSDLMKQMGRLPVDDRKRVGEVANQVKRTIETETDNRLLRLAQIARGRDLLRTEDVTLPGRPVRAGHLHILTQVQRELVDIFHGIGFEVATGPQVETD